MAKKKNIVIAVQINDIIGKFRKDYLVTVFGNKNYCHFITSELNHCSKVEKQKR